MITSSNAQIHWTRTRGSVAKPEVVDADVGKVSATSSVRAAGDLDLGNARDGQKVRDREGVHGDRGLKSRLHCDYDRLIPSRKETYHRLGSIVPPVGATRGVGVDRAAMDDGSDEVEQIWYKTFKRCCHRGCEGLAVMYERAKCYIML
ncbi:hypothetical protein HPP92_001140 [Vanilla planifolia]|uniref:Uncharacterized protein n=1 Tax=Vanilla planifolia TaxID=51239 RepID=A0A835VDA2_VANPL|nr:hypothetical protein HPP92_001140 [Vanilla planifolia]